MIRYVSLVLIWIIPYLIAAQITPPQQPAYGPGGSNYPHATYDSSRYGNDITDMYWLFEPNSPQPDSAAVVVVWHGMTMMADSAKVINLHLALVRHLARKGYSVIYPMYQYGGNQLSPYSYQRDVCAAIIQSALSRLQDGAHVYPLRDTEGKIMLATTGYSKGGAMSVTMASAYWMYNLPRFRAVADFVSFDPLAETDSIPADTKILIVLGEHDTKIGNFIPMDTLLDRYYALTHIPCENKHLLLVRSDSTGFPPLTADHHFYVADPGQPATLNALDYFGSWKLVTGLLNCAFYGACDHSLSVPDSITYMGRWSDGTAVEPISILDSCNTAAIRNIKDNQTFIRVYPNPFDQVIYIQINGFDHSRHMTFLLSDLLGQIVLKKNLNSSSERILLPGKIKAGMYIYQIRERKGGFVQGGKIEKKQYVYGFPASTAFGDR